VSSQPESYAGVPTRGVATFSLVARLTRRVLFVFDSFEGLPGNDENHCQNIFGAFIKNRFLQGNYRVEFEEVKNNITRFGEIDACRFVQGWFEQTLPLFSEPIAAVYLDVDLVSSTKVCLKYLYPLIVPGGFLYSQDGDLPLVMDVFRDDKFWERELGVSKPAIHGLGQNKMLKITKI
jgi:O-methyltransferase